METKVKVPVVTDAQREQLERTTLSDGKNAWRWVQDCPEDDRPWAAVGILSCVQKGYDLNDMMVCSEIRDIRSGRVPNPFE